MKKNLTQTFFAGFSWTLSSTIVNALLQVLYLTIISRLLNKADFGVVATGQVIIHFGTYFAQMGLSQSIVQKKNLTERNIRAAFTASVLLSSSFFALFYFSAPYIASYFYPDVKDLSGVIQFMSLGFLLTGLSSISQSILRRSFRFKLSSIIVIISYIIYITSSILLAYNGYGIWSVVWASLIQNTFSMLIFYFYARHSLLFTFKKEDYAGLFSYGSKISLIGFIDFIGSELDNIIIGKFAGMGNLGIYNRARMLIKTPVSYFTQSVSRILFPTISSIQDDTQKIIKAYHLAIAYTTFIIGSICLGIAVAADNVVLVVLGSKWLEASYIVSLLAVTQIFRIMSYFSGIFCDSLNLLTFKLYLQTAYLISQVILFWVFKDMGMIGFVYAIAINQTIKNFVYFFALSRYLKFSFQKFILRIYFSGFISSLFVAVAIKVVTLLLVNLEVNYSLGLLFQVFTGGITLLLCLVYNPDKDFKLLFINRIEILLKGKNLEKSKYKKTIMMSFNYVKG
jgi:O-antigen/teichoic acid export membrane protein